MDHCCALKFFIVKGFEYTGGGENLGFGGAGGFSFGGFDPMGMAGDQGGGFMDTNQGKSAEKKVKFTCISIYCVLQCHRRRQSSRDKQTLMPVTVKQILSAVDEADGCFLDGGVELSSVKIMGTVMSVTSHSTNLIYVVNDGTGTIECKQWIDKDNAMNPGFSQCRCYFPD